MASHTLTEKPDAVPVEADEMLKPQNEPVRDYTGAHEKVDPKEIALVRKLDLWIMPILWLMYWLNYLVSPLLMRALRVETI
jgi:hypothetical protein